MFDPVEKSVDVSWDIETAFRRFTDGIAEWWPIKTHSVGRDEAEEVVFETRAGGRLFERQKDGSEAEWAVVREWDPPHRFVLAWYPSRTADEAQNLEVRFEPNGSGTRVGLTHSGWEALGDRAEEARANYDSGWPGVLELYAK